jgi:ArsR family metal-binding transcriptional regulator
MALTDPKEKMELSKFLNPALAQSSIIRSEENMDGPIGQLLQFMDQSSDTHQPTALGDFLAFTAFDVTGEILFSKPYGYRE